MQIVALNIKYNQSNLKNKQEENKIIKKLRNLKTKQFYLMMKFS